MNSTMNVTMLDASRHEGQDVRTRPSAWFVALSSWRSVVLLGIVAWGAWAIAGRTAPARAGVIGAYGILVVVLRVVWAVLDWWSREYTLGEERVRATWGVVRRNSVEMDVARIQHLVVTRSLAERVLGLGTIRVTSAGSDGVGVVWRSVVGVDGLVAKIRERSDGARVAMRAVVIGLAGGIGAGKSKVARAFEALGCLVSDSDAEAKAALELPEVRAQLREWWGEKVFDAESGKVSRRALADVIFADAEARRRLEGLTHPIVRARRDEMVRRATAEGRPGVVVDAPLLFEAGLDKECDVVIFVDAPREIRLERVRRTRGWTEEELDRREKSQISLDEKRQRSDEVIVNDGGMDRLESISRTILEKTRGRIVTGAKGERV
ncbi:MAG: dephospho-CoA kinase [Phycisphaerales bacterium]|nr:MAG: dephospho-CoA kinase [Phycisphaerales bacterium]